MKQPPVLASSACYLAKAPIGGPIILCRMLSTTGFNTKNFSAIHKSSLIDR